MKKMGKEIAPSKWFRCTLHPLITIHTRVFSSSFGKYNKPSFDVEIGFIYFQIVVYYLHKHVPIVELLSFSTCENCLGILSWDGIHYNFFH